MAKQHAKITRKADVCPYCGAVERFRVYRTLEMLHLRRIVRYCRCKKCSATVTLTTTY